MQFCVVETHHPVLWRHTNPCCGDTPTRSLSHNPVLWRLIYLFIIALSCVLVTNPTVITPTSVVETHHPVLWRHTNPCCGDTPTRSLSHNPVLWRLIYLFIIALSCVLVTHPTVITPTSVVVTHHPVPCHTILCGGDTPNCSPSHHLELC